MNFLSNAELDILKLFWENKCVIPKKDIYKAINAKYPDKWKRNAIAVYLNRLVEKGCIRIETKDDEDYLRALKKSEYALMILSYGFQEKFTNVNDLLLGFVDEESDSDNLSNEIDDLIKKYDTDK